jgi:predicted sugar kinase
MENIRDLRNRLYSAIKQIPPIPSDLKTRYFSIDLDTIKSLYSEVLILFRITKMNLDRIEELSDSGLSWLLSSVEIMDVERNIEAIEVKVNQLRKIFNELNQQLMRELQHRELMHLNESSWHPHE